MMPLTSFHIVPDGEVRPTQGGTMLVFDVVDADGTHHTERDREHASTAVLSGGGFAIEVDKPFPKVPVDKHGGMTCPIPGCSEELRLVRSYEFVLTAYEDAAGDFDPPRSIVEHWQVGCIAGHEIWTIADEAARKGEDVSEPTAEYDHWSLHDVVHQIASGTS